MAVNAPRILDPRGVPIEGTDAHLPAVPEQRLRPAALRERLADPTPWTPEIPGDGARFGDRAPADASVLMALVQRGDDLRVLLTERTAHLRDHAGQVSFPGGRVEPGDADAVAAALREAEEEIGLARERVEVIGRLPVYTTITGFTVTPVVALVSEPVPLSLDPFEVASAFEVPLAFLMNPAHHRRHAFELGGVRRRFLSMPWHGPGLDGVEREFFIWGATAAMLRNFYARLSR